MDEPVEDAIHPKDREATLEAWREADQAGSYLIEHRTFEIATGDWRWHQARAKPIGNPAVEWFGTSIDIHNLRGLHHRQAVLLAELQHRTRNHLAVVQSMPRQSVRRAPSLQAFDVEFARRLGALSRVQGSLIETQADRIDGAVLDVNHGGKRVYPVTDALMA